MRKILSLVLIIFMIISTLALVSCDSSDISNLLNIFNVINDKNGRATVTEEEWKQNLKSFNYTFNMKEQGIEHVFLFDNGKVKWTDGEEVFYQFIEDGVIYNVTKSDTSWIARQSNSNIPGSLGVMLMGFGMNLNINDFEYSEETRLYTLQEEEMTTVCSFRDGVLQQYTCTIPNAYIHVSNVNSTVVEIPEYTIEE